MCLSMDMLFFLVDLQKHFFINAIVIQVQVVFSLFFLPYLLMYFIEMNPVIMLFPFSFLFLLAQASGMSWKHHILN